MQSLKEKKIVEWKLYAKTSAYRKAIDSAKRVVDKSLSFGKSVISWSTGKDSTAMVHLVKCANPDSEIIIQFDDCDWEEKRPYAERVSDAQGWTYHPVEPDFSVYEMAMQYDIGNDSLCSQSHDLTKYAFIIPLKNKQKELKAEIVYIGIRKEESIGRKKNINTRGTIHKMKAGIYHCYPMAYLRTIDVFAYLAANDIEINPCYFNNRFFEPEKIRISWSLPTPMGAGMGDIEQIKRYNPKQYQKIREKLT